MMMDRTYRRTSTMKGTFGGDMSLEGDLENQLIPKP